MEMKNEIKTYLSFFNELNDLINQNIGFLYYGDIFKINSDKYNNLIKDYKDENNVLKNLVDIDKDGKPHIVAWNLACKTNDSLLKMNEKIINNDIEILKEEYNELKKNIPVIFDSVEKLKECRDGILVINKKIIKYYDDIKCINTKVVKVSSINELEGKVDFLLKYIDSKIENRQKGFFSLIYKTFLPKKYKSLINDL